MPSYHIPRMLKTMESLPRNNMGKINKKELKKFAFPDN
jgi:non-ribosomal peptide synthetase component E (peptide arylation enzyme)